MAEGPCQARFCLEDARIRLISTQSLLLFRGTLLAQPSGMSLMDTSRTAAFPNRRVRESHALAQPVWVSDGSPERKILSICSQVRWACCALRARGRP